MGKKAATTMWLIGNRDEGFSFVELMVAVVILSVGLVFIIEGFIVAAGAMNTSSIRIQLVPILESKMYELELSAEENNGIERGTSEGEFLLDSRSASWNLEITGVEKEEELDLSDDLNEVKLEVSWQEKNLPRQIQVLTYLRNKNQ
jgi:prepilin-type N-terminal cleavage/methylation domain-containing protein